ncbi:MAG: sensor histidine kinase [Gemmatimonadota bacterium]
MTDAAHFIRTSPVALALLEGRGDRIGLANEAFAAAVGVCADELVDRPLPELFRNADRVRDRLGRVRDGGSPAATPFTSRAGSSLLLTAWRVPASRTGEREQVGILLTVDAPRNGSAGGEKRLADTLREVNEALLVTALREQAHAQEARSESEAKSVFLASVSHELRTPLNSILGYADLLESGVPQTLPEGLRGHVDRIQDAAGHLLSLIEQIIEASRAEFDERLDAEPFDIVAFVREVVELIRRRAEDAGLELRLNLPSSGIQVVTDRRKVRQVLLNLLVNAIKFTDEGHIGVEVERVEDTFVVRVTDTGIGITEEEQKQVFRRFWQAGASTVRTEAGMGIGLWVVRTLVDAMGGRVTLESVPGDGSTFEVVLPVTPREPARTERSDAARVPG